MTGFTVNLVCYYRVHMWEGNVFVLTVCAPVRTITSGADPGGAPGARAPPLTTKNEAPTPKFYKTEAPEWLFAQ